jgi:excisionase family DNA binding protein
MISENQVPELLTVDEASEVLRLKPSTVRSWVLKRRVPFIKLGSRVFLRLGDLHALIEAGFKPAQTNGGLA